MWTRIIYKETLKNNNMCLTFQLSPEADETTHIIYPRQNSFRLRPGINGNYRRKSITAQDACNNNKQQYSSLSQYICAPSLVSPCFCRDDKPERKPHQVEEKNIWLGNYQNPQISKPPDTPFFRQYQSVTVLVF